MFGAASKQDIGLSYLLNGCTGLGASSSNNNVRTVHTARSLGTGVKFVDGY